MLNFISVAWNFIEQGRAVFGRCHCSRHPHFYYVYYCTFLSWNFPLLFPSIHTGTFMKHNPVYHMASVNTTVSVNQQWASYPTDISPLILKLGLGASWVFLNAWIGICKIQDLTKAVVSYRWTGDRKVSLQQRIAEQMSRMEKKWGIFTVQKERMSSWLYCG